MLVVFGLPGAGKSEASRHIAKIRSLVHLEADFLRGTLSALSELTTRDRFRIAFSDVCSIVRENRHLSDRLVITGAMPEEWQWNLLQDSAGERAKLKPVHLDCPISVCLSRLEMRTGGIHNHFAKHSRSTLQQLSDMYHALNSDLFRNSVNATISPKEIIQQIELIIDED